MKRRLLFLVVWLLGLVALWLLLTRPRASFAWSGPVAVAASGIAVVVQPLPPPPPRVPDDPIFLPPPFWPSDLDGRGPVEAWDIASGRRLWTAHGPEVGIGVATTADGSRVLVKLGRPGDRHAGAVELRDALTGRSLSRFPADATFSPPDARYALRRSRDPANPSAVPGVLDLYETATGRWVRRLPEGPFPAFSGDGRRLLVPHYRYRGGKVYDTATGRLLATFAEPRAPEWLGTDGRRLIDAAGVVWDVDDHTGVGRVAAIAPGRMYGPDNGWVSPDGTWAATRLDGTDPAGRPAAEWAVLPTNERRTYTPPAGWRVSSLTSEAGGRLVDVSVRRGRSAGPVAHWLARQHPALTEWAATRNDSRRVYLDPRTTDVVAELPETARLVAFSEERRTVLVKTDRGLEVWEAPPPRGRWLWAGVWTVCVIGLVRLTARRTPSH